HPHARYGANPRFLPGPLPAPGRKLEGSLVGGARVHRVAVRDDYVLERKLEQLAKRRQRALLVPWRGPDAQPALALGQRIGEHQGALLRQPQRGLVTAPSIMKSDQASRKDAAGLDRRKPGVGNVVAPVQARAESAAMIAAHEQIDLSHVIRLENH